MQANGGFGEAGSCVSLVRGYAVTKCKLGEEAIARE